MFKPLKITSLSRLHFIGQDGRSYAAGAKTTRGRCILQVRKADGSYKETGFLIKSLNAEDVPLYRTAIKKQIPIYLQSFWQVFEKRSTGAPSQYYLILPNQEHAELILSVSKKRFCLLASILSAAMGSMGTAAILAISNQIAITAVTTMMTGSIIGSMAGYSAGIMSSLVLGPVALISALAVTFACKDLCEHQQKASAIALALFTVGAVAAVGIGVALSVASVVLGGWIALASAFLVSIAVVGYFKWKGSSARSNQYSCSESSTTFSSTSQDATQASENTSKNDPSTTCFYR